MMSKVALVTGSNKGIGYEIAKGLVERMPNGSTVLLGCRDLEKASEAVKSLSTNPNVKVDSVQMDLAALDTVIAAFDKIKTTYGGLDILVQNAAMAFRANSEEPFGRQAYETIRVNYFGTQTVLFSALPLMRAGGRIVVIGSQSGQLSNMSQLALERQQVFNSSNLCIEELNSMVRDFVEAANHDAIFERGWPMQAYGISKLATHSMCRIIARELPKGRLTPACGPVPSVRIEVCCPGWCKTDMAGWDKPPKTAEQGAEVPIKLALGELGSGQKGEAQPAGGCEGLWFEGALLPF